MVLFSSMLHAQEANILFNRLNMGVYNPAFTGTNGSFISLNSRAQWSSIADAPRTNYLIYQLPQRNKVFLGFTAQNDRVFIENKTHLTADYNYQLQIDATRFLYLGLKAGGFYNNIDVDRLQRLYTTYNPALAPVKSYFTPVLGVGVQWKTPRYFIGLGVPSIFNNKRFQDDGGWETTATDRPYAYFSGGVFFALPNDLTLEPNVIYRAMKDSPNLFMATVGLNYKDQFTVGTGLSNNDNLAFFVSSKSIKGLEWGYGYEFMNRSDATAIQGVTHEFSLRFMLGTKPADNNNESARKDGYDERN